MAMEAEELSLRANQPFRRLLLARGLAQTAQNALMFALFILVVEETGSSIQTSLLIIAFTLPSILLSVPAGVIVDFLPKRGVMVVGNLLRAAIIGVLIFSRGDIWLVYLLAMGFSTVGQFFAPAESASLPSLVRRHQLAGANSLMNFVLLLGQVTGTVILAPFLLKTLGDVPVFAVAVALYLAATWTLVHLSGIRPPIREEADAIDFAAAMRKGFELIRTNRKVFLSITYLAIALTLFKVVAVLAPRFTEEVLNISPEDVVFVAAPGAIGAVAGLVVAPLLARLIGTWRVVALGFFLFVLSLIGLGLVVLIRDFVLTHLDLGISFVEERVGVSSVITMTMILALPLGLAFSWVGVGARAVLNEEAPVGMQGRVFATQSALADLLTLVPLLLVAAIAELVGVRAVLLAAAIAGLALAIYLSLPGRFGSQPMAQQPAEQASTR